MTFKNCCKLKFRMFVFVKKMIASTLFLAKWQYILLEEWLSLQNTEKCNE